MIRCVVPMDATPGPGSIVIGHGPDTYVAVQDENQTPVLASIGNQAAAEGTARGRTAPDLGLVGVAVFGTKGPVTVSVVPMLDAMTAEVRPAILVFLIAVLLWIATYPLRTTIQWAWALDSYGNSDDTKKLYLLSKSKYSQYLLYTRAGHGSEMFKVNPELEAIVVRWLVEKLDSEWLKRESTK